jgi:hypothetical protein
MVYVRQTIVSDASTAMSRAVCIATRYSAVRRQFGASNGGLESQVICASPCWCTVLVAAGTVLFYQKRCAWDFL